MKKLFLIPLCILLLCGCMQTGGPIPEVTTEATQPLTQPVTAEQITEAPETVPPDTSEAVTNAPETFPPDTTEAVTDAPAIPEEHNYFLGKCTKCGTNEIDYTDIRLYASGLGYAFFETHEHGEGMRKLYDEMLKRLSEFHSSEQENAEFYQQNSDLGDLYLIGAFSYSDHGLTLEEAQTVYAVLRMDQPVFYWLSYWLYMSDSHIFLTTTKDYANGTDRAKCNSLLYAGLREYAEAAAGETTAYETALTYYEEIAKRSEYAYTADGDVENALWAHTVIGTFTHGRFVCEGYGKLFQMLLNLSGIENVYVSGEANGSHFWNAAKMDDGKWYWFDVTWGDGGDIISYTYFCAINGTMSDHAPTAPNTLGLYFNGTLPDCSDAPFASDGIFEIGEYAMIDGREYVRNGKSTVRGTFSATPFPPAIEYMGKTYTVTE